MSFAQPDGFVPGIVPPDPAPERARWFLFRGAQLLVAGGAGAEYPPLLTRAEALAAAPVRSQYLGALAGEHCFAGEAPEGWPAPDGASWRGLRALFGVLDDALLSVAGRALQLLEWDRNHLHCGACGKPTARRSSERSRECTGCGLLAYPRLAPVVMCLVRRGRSMLLARSPRFAAGMYSALAGFVEPGETLEQCVEREVFEEVGVRVRDLRYFASQPWPFPHSLMIAFFAEHAGGEIRVDGVEIEAADWFDAGKLPKLPARISIARRLIDAAMGEIAAS